MKDKIVLLKEYIIKQEDINLFNKEDEFRYFNTRRKYGTMDALLEVADVLNKKHNGFIEIYEEMLNGSNEIFDGYVDEKELIFIKLDNSELDFFEEIDEDKFKENYIKSLKINDCFEIINEVK